MLVLNLEQIQAELFRNPQQPSTPMKSILNSFFGPIFLIMVEQEHVDFCFVEIAMVIALFLEEIRIALSSCIALSCAVF